MTSRRKILALATTLALAAFLVGAGTTSATASAPEQLKLSWASSNSVLTLPSSDSFDDQIDLDATSNEAGSGTISAKRLSGSGGNTLLTTQSLSFTALGPQDYVAGLDIGDSGLTTGSWKVTVAVNGVTKTTEVQIGSGIAKTVTIKPVETKLYTNTSNDKNLTAQITAKDELGTSLPISGCDAQLETAHATFRTGGNAESPNAQTPGIVYQAMFLVPVNNGVGKVEALGVEGPTFSTHQPSASAAVTFENAKLTSASVKTSISTLYPNMEGYHGTETLTADIKTNAPDLQPLTNSYLEINRGSTNVITDPLSETGSTSLGWAGVISGSVIPGTYTAKVIAQLTGGKTITSETHFTVSAAAPVTRTLTESYPGKDLLKSVTKTGGKCKEDGSSISCSGVSGDVLVATGLFSVPSQVLKVAAGSGHAIGFTANSGVKVSNLVDNGSVRVETGAEGQGSTSTTITADGTTTVQSESLDGSTKKVFVDISLGNAVSLTVSKVTITYTYTAIG
jgi:hypothetical protein